MGWGLKVGLLFLVWRPVDGSVVLMSLCLEILYAVRWSSGFPFSSLGGLRDHMDTYCVCFLLAESYLVLILVS